MFLLGLMHKMRRLPIVHHCFMWRRRSPWNHFLQTGVILQFINQMMVMLLVLCAQILLLIDTGRISPYNLGNDLVITNESHLGPAPKAQIDAT
jgi:hypothetical protein